MLSDFLGLLPEEQEVMLMYEHLELRGTSNALTCLLAQEVFKGIVINVEAEDSVMKVWVKENACINS